MIIKGILKQEVSVDVDQMELFMGLSKTMGIEDLFNDRYGMEVILRREKTKEGEKPFLIYSKDVSYHGSPLYKEYKRVELTDRQEKCAKLMKELYNVLKTEL